MRFAIVCLVGFCVAVLGGGASGETPAPPLDPANILTEERWTIMEVCDQIYFLLHPELLKQASADSSRIAATHLLSEPVSYSVSEGPARSKVTLTSSVWDPVTYQAWCKAVSSEAASADASTRPDILSELLTPDTTKFLGTDERLSGELAAHPHQPEIYTDAALLLGTMAWFDGAGYFQDYRPLLNRMTAFLAVADALGAKGQSREIAEILRLVLVHDQVSALKKIAAARTAGNLPQPWLDALEVTASGDWRKTEPTAAGGPLLLQLAHYHVLTENMGANKAESFLEKLGKPPATVSWLRYITQSELNVGQGHHYCQSLLGMEAAEAGTIAKAQGFGEGLDQREKLAKFVTAFDGRTSYERAPDVHVVGQQLWAGQVQRHFLQAVVAMHHFLTHSLGVPESAQKLSEATRKSFSTAYYLPFLSIKIEKAGSPLFKEAQTAAENIVREHPTTVAPKLWAELKPESPEGIARKTPDFHVFFNPELPRQTSFEAGKRIFEIGVGDENSLPLLKSILVRCPYDYEMAIETALVEGRPNDIEQKREEYQEPFAGINRHAIAWAIYRARGNPQKCERLLLEKTTWDPSAYMELFAYFFERNDKEKAEKYLLSAHGKVDAVMFSNSSGFLVKQYVEQNRMKEAEELAKEARDTYSARGLGTYAWLKESQKEWSEAAQTYKAIDERYESKGASQYVSYILRRKSAGEGFLPEYQSTLDAYFSRGLEKVTLADLGKTAPTKGVTFSKITPQLEKIGAGPHDIVVSVDGYRVENRDQYFVVRDMSESPDIVFIIWDGQGYSEIKAHQQGRRFGVDIFNYQK